MLKSTILSFTCCFFLGSQFSLAQCVNFGSDLVAPYTSNSSNKGVMFDISALNTVTIYCFDVNMPDLSTGDYEIYYRIGSYLGFENSSGDWTLIGSANSVSSLGSNTPTPLPIDVNIVIPSGEIYGFYITATNASPSSEVLTTSGPEYSIIASNGDMEIVGGNELDYPFSTLTADRNFNGTIHFTGGDALPVEFTDFSAIKVNQHTLLEWGTESEKNSNYFEIERSKNGIEWNRLLTIKAAGESTTFTAYQAIDAEPLDGISYYRLTQYDLDGAHLILKTVSFDNETEIEGREIRVFPNPITERVRVFGDKTELHDLKILNSIGQDISEDLTIIRHDGYSEIYFRDQQEGIFILKSETNSQILIKK